MPPRSTPLPRPRQADGMPPRVSVAEAEGRVWAGLGLDPIEHRVRVDGVEGTVRVLEVGEGPPALFVHGTSVAAPSWADLAAGLPQVRCLLLDRPGCGSSDPYADPVEVADAGEVAARLVVDVLDGLEVDRAHLVGTSLGGFHAVRGAAAHPDRVGRLVLLGWVLGTPDAPPPVWLRLGSHPVMARLGAVVPPTAAALRGLLSRFGMRRAIAEGALGPDALAWLLALYRDTDTLRNETVHAPRWLTLRGGWDPRVLHDPELLAEVRAPTLVVVGDEDPFTTPAAATALAGALHAEVHVLPDTGHAPWLDAPQRVASLVGAFLGG